LDKERTSFQIKKLLSKQITKTKKNKKRVTKKIDKSWFETPRKETFLIQ